MVLYRFCEQSNFHLSDIQLVSIVEDSVPAMAIALTSHHSTRWVISAMGGRGYLLHFVRIHIVPDTCQKPNMGLWVFFNCFCPYLGTYRYSGFCSYKYDCQMPAYLRSIINYLILLQGVLPCKGHQHLLCINYYLVCGPPPVHPEHEEPAHAQLAVILLSIYRDFFTFVL